jgi:hypothetical protein
LRSRRRRPSGSDRGPSPSWSGYAVGQ